MNWPTDWIDIHLGGKTVNGGPDEYITGLFQIVTQWQDAGKRNHAFGLLSQLMQPAQYPSQEYRHRTELLAVATLYASIGLSDPPAVDFCIDTLEELVP